MDCQAWGIRFWGWRRADPRSGPTAQHTCRTNFAAGGAGSRVEGMGWLVMGVKCDTMVD
jgi:hypothetical protein